MDKKSKEALRRYKKSRQAQSSSESSSSSDSDSGSSSSYSSSDSDRRHRHKKAKQSGSLRRSSSSSDDRHKREKRDHCQKKLEAKRNHLKRKLKEAKLKKKAAAAAAALSGHSHRALSPATQAKLKKLAERKHLRAASKERREREKEKHRAALREREREHHRAGSRSPTKITKIRIHQDVKRQKSPPRVHHQLMSREKIIIQTRTRDRTPSAEKERQRHEHKLRHDDVTRERERREREAARDKERADALARCQERQRERERLAREKLRREEEEKYGKVSGSSDRLLVRASEREVPPVRGYDTRERSAEHSKREVDSYEHGYVRKHRGEGEFEEEPVRRTHLDREELLREREYLARRRELSPGDYVGTTGSRMRGNPRDLYTEEEREISYKRMYMDEGTARGHPANREAWLAERELREREMHDHTTRDYRDIESERVYVDERERLPPRERPQFVGRPGQEWKRNDWGSPRERAEWQEEGGQIVTGRGIGFVGGPKRGGAVGIVSKIPPIVQQREQRPPSEPDWDTEEGQIDTPKKPEGATKRDWIEHDQREIPLNRDKLAPASRLWNSTEWREGEDVPAGPTTGYQRMPPGVMMHHARSDRGGRGGYRGRGGHIDHGERLPGHGFRPHHSAPLLNLPVPMPGYHGVGPIPRFPNKRNMTYTNPNIIRKQQAALAAAKAAAQASAVAAATTAVAAAKAAAQSAANATTNPGILGQVTSYRPQPSDEKPEAGEIVGDNEQKDETLQATVDLSTEQKEKKNSGELSEISDSDDDILNKTEKKAKAENDDYNSQANEEKKKISDNKGDDEEIMDFEEISDGELEEERAAKGVGDALGVDWSSLVAETKRVPTNQTTTAKQKWQPHRIILDVGISMRMASEEYAKRLLKEAKQQLDDELKNEDVKTETKVDIKMEIKDEVSSLSTLDEDSQATGLGNDDNSTCDIKAKEEIDNKSDVKTSLTDEIAAETFNVDILPPLACMQVSQQKLQIERRQLITNACGINSRALSARQDLKLRRQLCGLPARECEINRNLPQTSDKLKAMALAAFQRTLQVN